MTKSEKNERKDNRRNTLKLLLHKGEVAYSVGVKSRLGFNAKHA